MTLKERIELLRIALHRALKVPVYLRAAGIIVKKDDKFLLVQEKRAIPEIFGRWNFPMGRMKRGESPFGCALREGREETNFFLKMGSMITPHTKKDGYDVNIGGIINMFVYLFEASIAVASEKKVPPDLLDVQWFSIEEIQKFQKEGKLLHHYILSAIADYQEKEFARRAASEILKKAPLFA